MNDRASRLIDSAVRSVASTPVDAWAGLVLSRREGVESADVLAARLHRVRGLVAS